MSSTMSKHYSDRQLAAIDKIGNVLLPGYEDMPPFSETRCVRHADRVLDHMPEGDRKDLGMLLTIFSFLPGFVVGWIMAFFESGSKLPDPVGAGLRFVRLGLRGLVMTLYYCDDAILKKVGYDARVHTADFKPYVLPG